MGVWAAGCHGHAALSTLSGAHAGSIPPRGLQLPTERADYGESAPIDPLRRQRKYKGTKRDFSLVEDLGVLLCLEGGKKAEGGLHTMGRH